MTHVLGHFGERGRLFLLFPSKEGDEQVDGLSFQVSPKLSDRHHPDLSCYSSQFTKYFHKISSFE